jgi:hypothetical protein
VKDKTMARSRCLAIAHVAVTSLALSPLAARAQAQAEPRDPNAAPQEDKVAVAGGDFAIACQAASLVLRGEAMRSPMMLLAAAELLLDVMPGDSDVTQLQAEVTGGDPQALETNLPALQVDALIARARELAKDNPELLEAVEVAAARLTQGSRGITYDDGKNLEQVTVEGVTCVVLNWRPEHQRLDPGYEYTCSDVDFEAQKPAIVAVIGDGDGDLDLWVYDDNSGSLIGSDTDSTSTCVVSWTPIYEGPFTIKVKNVGGTWERFMVLANW